MEVTFAFDLYGRWSKMIVDLVETPYAISETSDCNNLHVTKLDSYVIASCLFLQQYKDLLNFLCVGRSLTFQNLHEDS